MGFSHVLICSSTWLHFYCLAKVSEGLSSEKAAQSYYLEKQIFQGTYPLTISSQQMTIRASGLNNIIFFYLHKGMSNQEKNCSYTLTFYDSTKVQNLSKTYCDQDQANFTKREINSRDKEWTDISLSFKKFLNV